jgi:hypothetical protein
LAAPLFLYGVAFILRGTGADWDRIFGETGAPFARAILVFGLLLLAARETAIRFAHPAKRHWERAWEKAADRF